MSDEARDPDKRSGPEATAEPETTAEPEATAEPEQKPEPEATAESEGTSEPDERPEGDRAEATASPSPSVAIVELAGGGARMALIGLLVVALVALVGVGVLGSRALAVRAEADARREATRTAEDAARAILAYDYRHLDRDLERANRFTTGKFATEYEKTSRNVLRKTAPDVEAVVKAEVMASSVVRASPDEVVCLLFVNQTTQSNVRSQSVPDRNRVRMTMSKVDDSWKVSDLDAL